MKQKKVPMRKCTGCGEMKPKRELVRVVKAPDVKDENGEIIAKGEVSLDLSGKKPGRGAYICSNPDCFKKAVKAKRLERAFSAQIPEEILDEIEKELSSVE